jgi:hypothetical protein
MLLGEHFDVGEQGFPVLIDENLERNSGFYAQFNDESGD